MEAFEGKFIKIAIGDSDLEEGWVKSAYHVETVDDGPEGGWIEWNSTSDRFMFFPNEDTLYEESSLRDIADFCEAATKERKAKKV